MIDLTAVDAQLSERDLSGSVRTQFCDPLFIIIPRRFVVFIPRVSLFFSYFLFFPFYLYYFIINSKT